MRNALDRFLGNRCTSSAGEMRPSREGPSKMPPTISPTTRACPSLVASHAQAIVVSRTTEIWMRSRFIKAFHWGCLPVHECRPSWSASQRPLPPSPLSCVPRQANAGPHQESRQGSIDGAAQLPQHLAQKTGGKGSIAV